MNLFGVNFLLCSTFIFAAKTPRCEKENEVWGCVSPCDPTCSNPSPAKCKVACTPQCACAKGYLRNSRGECIAEQLCNECNTFPLQEYTTCGSDCPSCQNFAAICPLPRICFEGCFCISGYLQNSLGQCILVEKCQSCEANSEFREGVSGCPPSCEEPYPPFCPTFEREDKCSCIEGYVIGPDDTCVLLEDCKSCSCCR